MGFFDDLTGNQKFALLMTGMLLVAGLVLPFEAYQELLGFSGDLVTKDEVWTAIEDYLDQGVGGSPFQTVKLSTYVIDNVDVSGTVYYTVQNSTSGRLWFYGVDASNIINSVIGNMSDLGGRIYIRKGEYPIVNDITDHDKHNIELCGEGANATRFVFSATRPIWFAAINLQGNSSYPIENWFIHDLAIDGNSTGQGSVDQFGIYLTYLHDSTFERIYIFDIKSTASTAGGKGFDTFYCKRVNFLSCRVELQPNDVNYGKNCYAVSNGTAIIIDSCYGLYGSNGANLYQGTTLSIVSNSHFLYNTYGGAVIYRNASWNTIIGNTIKARSTTQGIYVGNNDYSTEPCMENTISGNAIYNGTVQILLGRPAKRTTVVGNTMTDSFGYGMNIFGDENVVDGNIIKDAATLSIRFSTADGDTADENLVTSNYIYGTATGIRLDGALDNTVSDNILYDPIFAFQITGASNGTVFYNNRVRGPQTTRAVVASSGFSNVFIDNDFGIVTYRLIDTSVGVTTTFIENNLTDTGGSKMNNDLGSSFYFYNYGYLTEACGLATNLGDGSNIAHGLIAKPTHIQLTLLNITDPRGASPVKVHAAVDYANTDATNISVDLEWANCTAIPDGIALFWDADYHTRHP